MTSIFSSKGISEDYMIVKKADLKMGVTATALTAMDGEKPSDKKVDQKDVKETKEVAISPPKLLKNPLRLFGKPKQQKHPKYGGLDIYTVIVTTPSGATSDASGNIPGYFNAGGQLVNAGSWSTLATMFDIVRLKKLRVHFEPKLGWKTARSYTPLTASACQTLRVANDPEGALSSPSTANMLARSPCSGPYACKDFSFVDPFTWTYTPIAEIQRFSATAVTALTMHDWCDVGDVNSYAINGTLVGGLVWNNMQNGACPASTEVFSCLLTYECEFALRNG